jgi:hypothetical protein
VKVNVIFTALNLTLKIHTRTTICFDLDGKIKKYMSSEKIIEDLSLVRTSH